MQTLAGDTSRGQRPDPLFLFSLPRSGSTLAQRVLGAHSEVATLAEPWLLLPGLYALRDRGVYAEYHHRAASTAISDFCNVLPGGQGDYLEELREFALGLYSRVSPDGTRYFLDKTPRYHLVADEILSMFPEGKFIFLWRNPLAVVASIMETWADGRWNLHGYGIDLFDGLEGLVKTYEKYSSRAYAVRYEDLLTSPEESWRGIFEYLELPFESSVIEGFARVDLRGKAGDPTGIKRYGKLSQEPLKKWGKTLANPIRQAWCRRYLHWIGEERLAIMGYDLNELLNDLAAIPSSMERMVSDVVNIGYGQAREFFEPRIFKQKLQTLPDWKRIRTHR